MWPCCSLSTWLSSVFSFICGWDLQPKIHVNVASQSFVNSMASYCERLYHYTPYAHNDSKPLSQLFWLFTIISSPIMHSQVSHSRRGGVCREEVMGEYAFLTSITETFNFSSPKQRWRMGRRIKPQWLKSNLFQYVWFVSHEGWYLSFQHEQMQLILSTK